MDKLHESALASPGAQSATIPSVVDFARRWLEAILDVAALEVIKAGVGQAVMANFGCYLFLFCGARRQLVLKPRVQVRHD